MARNDSFSRSLRSPALASVFCAAALVAASAPAWAEVERFSGEARSKDGQLVYREEHEVEWEGDRLLRAVTRYYDARGAALAELRSDFRRDMFAPDYTFRDAQGRVLEGARIEGSTIVLSHGQRVERIEGGFRGRRLVLGQGLHHYARQNLDAFAGGKDAKVRFGIPSRLDTYDFRIKPTPSNATGIVGLKITVDDWFLSLLAPSIEVEYDRATKRLVSYRGVSNLEGPDGEPMNVVIRYKYPQERAS